MSHCPIGHQKLSLDLSRKLLFHRVSFPLVVRGLLSYELPSKKRNTMNIPFEECSSQLRPKYWALEIFHELEKRMHKVLKCAVVAAAIAVMMMATTTLTFAQINT